jgi:hypothetical protein
VQGLDAGLDATPLASSSQPDVSASATFNPLDADLDASTQDATSDAGASAECQTGNLLFTEDYETGDLSSFTSADYGVETCQQTSLSTDRAVSGQHAFKSHVVCSTAQDHEHYGALQFSGSDVLSAHRNNGAGIDSPSGVVVSFWTWIDLGFTPGNAQWLSLVLLSGSCDWSDTVLSVATGNSSSRLAVSHTSEGGGSASDYPSAPALPQQTWTHVTLYINYHDGVLVAWQDGVPVTRADFVRPGSTLCHVRVGAYVSAASSQVLMYLDDTQVWELAEPLAGFDSAPCLVDSTF